MCLTDRKKNHWYDVFIVWIVANKINDNIVIHSSCICYKYGRVDLFV